MQMNRIVLSLSAVFLIHLNFNETMIVKSMEFNDDTKSLTHIHITHTSNIMPLLKVETKNIELFPLSFWFFPFCFLICVPFFELLLLFLSSRFVVIFFSFC